MVHCRIGSLWNRSNGRIVTFDINATTNIQTNVVWEFIRANSAVVKFFHKVTANQQSGYISVIPIGELHRGVELASG